MLELYCKNTAKLLLPVASVSIEKVNTHVLSSYT